MTFPHVHNRNSFDLIYVHLSLFRLSDYLSSDQRVSEDENGNLFALKSHAHTIGKSVYV